MRLHPLPAAAALLALALPAAALDLGGHDRDGTVIGVNAGSGWSEVAFNDADGATARTPSEAAFTGGFNVGWARNDHLLGSIGFYGWKHSFGQDLAPASVTMIGLLAEVAWFPRGEGFWLKGGAGWGTLDVSATLPGGLTSYQEGGFAWSAGAGYEFRMSEQAAVGLAYDYREVKVGEFDFLQDTKAITHAVTCSLRFYMM